MRQWMNLVEATFYRGTRHDPEKTNNRASMSFTDDPDVASVYAANPATGQYADTSRVSRAQFELKNPVDFSHRQQIDLNTAFADIGVMDASEHLDDVLQLVYGLEKMHDRGVPFHFKIANGLDWEELRAALRRACLREDWDRFFNLLDYTEVDTYAICDTKTFTRIAKEHGFDGVIHQDVFDQGAKAAPGLIGKTMANSHLTYRPFGDVKWG